MKTGMVITLVVAAAALGVAAWMVDRSGRASTVAGATDLPARVLEVLEAKVNDVASVTIKRSGVEFTVSKGETDWVVVEKGNYPVKIEQVKEAIVTLAELKPVERKTSKPENYSKIGVQEPEVKGPDGTIVGSAGPALVTLRDKQGQVLGAAIVGNQKPGTNPEVYVRKAGDAQAWLASGRLEVPGDALGWVDRQIMNLPKERIKSGTIVLPDGQSVTASREKPEEPMLAVQNIPAGRELTSASAAEPIAQELNYMTLEDVAPAATAGFVDPAPEGVEPGPHSEFHTFDGLVVRVQTLTKAKKAWAKFEVSFDEGAATAAAVPDGGKGALKPGVDVKKEASELQAKVGAWGFQISEYKAKALATKMDDLLKPLVAPTPEGAAGAPESGPTPPQQPMPSPAPAPPSAS